MTEPKYSITCTESQLKLINRALERFFRLDMGQFWDYCDDICLASFNWEQPQGAERDKDFYELIDRRDMAREWFDAAYRATVGRLNNCITSEEDQRAIDIWHVIRHQLWLDKAEPKVHGLVDSDPPLIMSGDPAVIVRRVEE